MHHEQLQAVVSEHEQRNQRNDVERKDELLAKKCKEIVGEQRERHEVQSLRRDYLHRGGRECRECEYEKQVDIPVHLRKNVWTREPDHEEEHQNNGKGQKDIPAPHHSPVSRIADTRIIFGAIGIQNLLDISGHDLTLGDDDGPGGDNTLGRRNFRRVFGVHEF